MNFMERMPAVIARIELSSKNENYEKPAWLGDEVTTDHRYYNAYLSSNPNFTS
jgi:CYTH domain-containing protein